MPNWPLLLHLLLLVSLQRSGHSQQPFFERAPASRVSWANNFTSSNSGGAVSSIDNHRRSGHPEDLFVNPAGLTLDLPASAFDDFTSTFFGTANNNQPNRRREPVSFRGPFEPFNSQPFVDNVRPRQPPPPPAQPQPPFDARRGNNFNGNGNNLRNNNNFARVNGNTNNNNFNEGLNNGPVNSASGRGRFGPPVVSNVRSFDGARPWSPDARSRTSNGPVIPPRGGGGGGQPLVSRTQPQGRRGVGGVQPAPPNPRLQGEPGASFTRNINNNNFNLAPSSVSSFNPVPASCLSCLCVASTGCDVKKQCVGEFCGPFLISWPYWSDAGKPGGDYVKCALNRECAEAAVQGYMKKWTRDCNGDGIVDCDDFAAIHKLGPHMCREESVTSTPYWSAYETCSARSRSPGPNAGPLAGDRGAGGGGGNFQGAPGPINAIRGRGRSNLDFVLGTTPRPAIDLPLITPRRRLTSSSVRQENPDGSPSTITRNFVESTGNNLPFNASFSDASDRVAISKECFECMCEASSGCERDVRCNTPDRDTQVCGPYQLDRSYWRLAGRPGFGGSPNDFEACASDSRCAEDTMSKFMKRMSFDCNEDGVVDCLDYAAIHKAGVKHCNSQWFLESKYWSQFERCYGFSR